MERKISDGGVGRIGAGGERQERIVDWRSVLIGLIVVLVIFAGAAAWKLAVAPEKKQPKPPGIVFRAERVDIEKVPPPSPPLPPLVRPKSADDAPELAKKRNDSSPMPDRSDNEPAWSGTEAPQSVGGEIGAIPEDVPPMRFPDQPEGAEVEGVEIVSPLDPPAVISDTDIADMFRRDTPPPKAYGKAGLVGMAPTVGSALRLAPPPAGDQAAPAITELGPVDMNAVSGKDDVDAIKRDARESRSAVELALRWLVTHQNLDGSWGGGKGGWKWDADDTPYDEALLSKSGDGGVAGTGFALMALMGGGHNLRRGEHRAAVIRGIEWLMSAQNKHTGYLGSGMYEHAIGTIALCEAVGRSPDARVGLAARRAVEACVLGLAKDGGWRYVPKAKDSDVSVTSWFMQALKTAKLANIKFEHSAFSSGMNYIDRCTDKLALDGSSGAVSYSAVPVEDTPEATGPARNGNPALTCAAMVIRQFNGMGVKHPILVGGAELTRQLPPDWDKKNFYYWYYATYAMHNMGGEYRLWWNRRIRDVLVDHQSKRGHQTGSWSPKGEQWLSSREMTTAVGALCLEVYDRYGEALQSFGTVPSVEELFFRK